MTKILLHVVTAPPAPNKPQHFLVVDKIPEVLFERVGSYLIGEKDGFHQCYGLSGGVGSGAFANREFEIPMKDGSFVKAQGQWWDCSYPGWKDKKFGDYGVNTIDNLRECFVFYGGYSISQEFIDDFMNNTVIDPTLYKELEQKLWKERAALVEFRKAFPDECTNLKRGELPISEKWIGFFSAYTTIKKESNKWMNKYFIASNFIDQVSEFPQSQDDIDNMEEERGGQTPFDEIDFQGEYVEISSKAKECLNKIRAVKDE